ncbi:MAG: beta-propeller fold lactonase family protein, partial [bacterium]
MARGKLLSRMVIALILCSFPFAFFGCSHDIIEPQPAIESIDYGGIDNIVYSKHIQPIWDQKCNSSSCHNSIDRANGLDLTSWEALIRGSDFGENIISGNAERSHLMEHIRGIATPRMPIGRDPLPDNVIDFIDRWINEGAKNDAGERPYEGITQKAYVTNQGDDFISVISTEFNLVTRLIPVGNSPALDVPHNIWVDNQNQFWYTTLISTGELWKFDVATDSFQGKVNAGRSPANVVTSPDGQIVYVTNFDAFNGNFVQVINTATMQKIEELQVGFAPHGINFSHDGQFIYITNYFSDSISIIRADNHEEVDRVLLAEGLNPIRSTIYRPLQVVLTPDDRFAYVSCFGAGQVRVLDTITRTVIAVVTVGEGPFLLEITPDGKFVYVANLLSHNVSVIRVEDNQVAVTIENESFANPHGVAFSKDGRFAYITNENLDGSFEAHHPTEGGGNPGNVQVVDTETLEVIRTI